MLCPSPEQTTAVCLRDLLACRHRAHTVAFPHRQHLYAENPGAHASKRQGRGIDFAELRAYQAGDDIRHIDWRVTARSGRVHTKMFRQEQERPFFLVVDNGPSMHFGTRRLFKSVLACHIAATLGWAALAHHECIGMVISDGQHITKTKPKAGKRGLLHVLNQLTIANQTRHTTAAPEHLATLLQHLQMILRAGSLIFLLSDFSSLTDAAKAQLKALRKHNALTALGIFDVLETAPPPEGLYRVTDGKHSHAFYADKAFRHAYRDHFQHQARQRQHWFLQHRIPYLALTSEDDIAARLQHHFRCYPL